MGRHHGDRAIVLGAGMAGLLTARVLSPRYREVVIVERDHIVDRDGARRGVPQAHHAHALLAKGQQVLEDLFPGLQAELTDAGIPSGDLAGSLRWYFHGTPLRQQESGLLSVSATRPELEAHVRSRVVALPNVVVRQRCRIRGITTDPGHGRVTGARIVGDGPDAATEVVPADLVVDATGRGSRTPLWLSELGYERPAEDRIAVDLAYTSRLFRLRTDPFGPDLAINPVASPANPRGAFFVNLPGDIALLSLTGLLGDHPPLDHEGFLAFARTLDAPEIYDAVSRAEPIGEVASFKVPASVRRRYDRLTRFPDGLVVIGDGVCAFNPVYGQGMTVAALEAVALGDHIDAGGIRPLRFFREINSILDAAWDVSTGGDLAFPGVRGPRPLKWRMGNAFMSRLHAAATVDGRFTAAFFRVAGMVDGPEALMRPAFALAVLRAARLARTAARTRTPRTTAGQARPRRLAA